MTVDTALLIEILQNLYCTPDIKKITVSSWSEQWLETTIADKGIRQKESIISAICNHVVPVIGDMPIQNVRYLDCLKVLAQISDASYSLRSKVLTNMRNMFEAARRNRLILENPCDGIKAGGKKPTEKPALSPDQVVILEDAVRDTRAEPFVLLGLYSGLRREEILGLKWDSIDLSAPTPTLTVRRVVRWEHSRPTVSENLKSAAARRTIPLPHKLAVYLRSIQRLEGFVIGNGAPLSETQYKNLWNIVRNRMTGEKTYRKSGVDHPEKTTISREIGATARNSKVRYTIDFPVTPHILRHTYITQLVLSGANIKRVQYLAGHSNPQITLRIYTHLAQSNPQDLALDVNNAFPPR